MSKNNWGGKRKGAGRKPLDEDKKKKRAQIYLKPETKELIEKYGKGNNFSQKVVELIKSEIKFRMEENS
ncbi:hypothetical protein MWH25_01085 [Natroniella acetigena]|uniref:hypothetical protein n=1 Tax=Natroniella acetigena TaxID=52004 RepID=UPI00200AC1F4|nr:hypothetical protein [Natroniella acetigena]MCK8826341.1 hypothetical protein [Natroniella acetigena]